MRIYNFRFFRRYYPRKLTLLRRGKRREVEENMQTGRKEEKGKGKSNWPPMWINMATPLHWTRNTASRQSLATPKFSSTSIMLSTTLFDWNYCSGKYYRVFRHFSIQLRCITIHQNDVISRTRPQFHCFKGPVRRSVSPSVRRSVRRTVRWYMSDSPRNCPTDHSTDTSTDTTTDSGHINGQSARVNITLRKQWWATIPVCRFESSTSQLFMNVFRLDLLRGSQCNYL
jgi:hypothetical protein